MPNPNGWMQTATGKAFDFETLEEICLEDIVRSLSMQCRFNGHTPRFYSVAQHSLIVANNLLGRLVLSGLLHDASEAYLGDVVRPLKRLFPAYKELENRLLEKIMRRYGAPWPVPEEVLLMDNHVLAAEKIHACAQLTPREWEALPEPIVWDRYVQKVADMSMAEAEESLLWRIRARQEGSAE